MEKASSQEDGCCKDELQSVKLQIDQKTNPGYSDYTYTPAFEGTFPLQDFLAAISEQLQITDKFSRKRKRGTNIPVFLRCCNFRI